MKILLPFFVLFLYNSYVCILIVYYEVLKRYKYRTKFYVKQNYRGK